MSDFLAWLAELPVWMLTNTNDSPPEVVLGMALRFVVIFLMLSPVLAGLAYLYLRNGTQHKKPPR
jgi:hypothetical protein